MSSAAQSLIHTRVKPQDVFVHFAYGAVIVSSQLDDPHGTLTRRYLGLAQKAAGISDEEKPGAKALRARDRDIAEHTNLKRLDEDGDGCDAGRAIKGHIKKKDEDDIATNFWLGNIWKPSTQKKPAQPLWKQTAQSTPPTPVMTTQQVRDLIENHRQSQSGLQHFCLAS